MYHLQNALILCLVAQCALAQLPLGPRSVAPGHRIVRRDSISGSGTEQVAKQKPKRDLDIMQAEQSTGGYGNSVGGGSYGGGPQSAGGYAMQSGYQQAEPQHPPMPFSWVYDINDGYGTSQFHKENGDENGKRTGSYGYMDAYGVYRQVEYEADHNGFRAVVKTNEPGTTSDDPADVDMTAEAPPAQTNPGTGSGYSSAGTGSSYKQQGYGSNSMTSGASYGGAAGGSSGKQQQQQQSYSSGGSTSGGGTRMMNMKQSYGGSSSGSMMMMPMRRSYGGGNGQMSPVVMRKSIGGMDYSKPPQSPMNRY